MSDEEAAVDPNAGSPPLVDSLLISIYVITLIIHPTRLSVPELTAVGGISLAVCTLSFIRGESKFRPVIVCWVVVIGLFGVVFLLRDMDDTLVPAAGMLVTVGALLSYGLHRYERVSLGLISEKS
jgi:peptidoglycan/LPS O-acetylase OafA/YrhL